TVAYNFESNSSLAIEGNFFFLEQRGFRQRFFSNGALGTPVLGRPFFNVNANNEDIDPIAIPGILSGGIAIDTPRQFYGTELNLLYHYSGLESSRFVMLGGFRYLVFKESLATLVTASDIPGLGVAGNSYIVSE